MNNFASVQMVVKVKLTYLLMVLAVHGATTNSENDQRLKISPAYPVRFKNDSMVMKIKTVEEFVVNYHESWATVSFNDDMGSIDTHDTDVSDKAAIFNYNLDKIKKSGIFNATVYTNDVVFVGQTFITAVNEPRHSVTVMMENSKDKLYCLDHDDLESNLITAWYKNGQMIQEMNSTEPLEITAKGIGQQNYTCVIGTQQSIDYYGSIEKAMEAGATVTVRKTVGDDTEIEVDKPGSHGLIVGIIITIIVIGAIVIVLFCFWRKKMYCWEDRKDANQESSSMNGENNRNDESEENVGEGAGDELDEDGGAENDTDPANTTTEPLMKNGVQSQE